MSEVATEQVSTGGESGNDSGYMGDAFNDYLEVESTETETPEEDQNTQGNTPEEPGKEEQPKTEGENPKEEPKDVFTLAFEGANGDLDYEKIMSTSFTDNKQFQELPVEEVKEDPEAITPEQEIEQEKQFRESFKTARIAPLQRAYELLQSGVDAETALNTAYSEILAETDTYFKSRDDQQFTSRREEKLAKIEQEAKEVAREARLTEISRSNALSIVNTLPGSDQNSKVALYNHIMFSDDAGGALLEDMFMNAYPEFDKMKHEDLDKAKRSFVNKLQADPARLKRHFDRAYRLLAASPANLKRFAQSISRNKEQQVRSNALAAQKSPQGSVNRPPQAQSNSMWDGYLGISSKTRI